MKWRSASLQEQDGVIVASSRDLEWLLPWWWVNYRLHNAYPVTFVSFNMSEGAIDWCRRRGEFVQLPIGEDFLVKKEQIDPAKFKIWGQKFKLQHWDFRSNWMKKPLAMLQSPYRRTVWFDLDCQVRKPIDAMFATCENPAGVAIVKEPEGVIRQDIAYGIALPGEIVYNSGVVVFERNSTLINKWVDGALHRNAEFYGDQEILSRIIHEEKLDVQQLPAIYNWVPLRGVNTDAAVLHWAGTAKHDLFGHIRMLLHILNVNLGILPPWI